MSQLILNTSVAKIGRLVKDHVEIALVSVILILMLSGTVLSSTLVVTSHAQGGTGAPVGAQLPQSRDSRPDQMR